MKTATRVQALIAPVVEALGYELVGVEFLDRRDGALLRIYIDREEGITAEDCERVSHQVSGVLDVEDPIRGGYRLEVSSPGFDRPLFELGHFERFSGHHVQVRLAVPLEGRKNFKGRLDGVDDEEIVIDVDGTVHRLRFRDIAAARLVPEF